jgi:hypothetical protein
LAPLGAHFSILYELSAPSGAILYFFKTYFESESLEAKSSNNIEKIASSDSKLFL